MFKGATAEWEPYPGYLDKAKDVYSIKPRSSLANPGRGNRLRGFGSLTPTLQYALIATSATENVILLAGGNSDMRD